MKLNINMNWQQQKKQPCFTGKNLSILLEIKPLVARKLLKVYSIDDDFQKFRKIDEKYHMQNL